MIGKNVTNILTQVTRKWPFLTSSWVYKNGWLPKSQPQIHFFGVIFTIQLKISFFESLQSINRQGQGIWSAVKLCRLFKGLSWSFSELSDSSWRVSDHSQEPIVKLWYIQVSCTTLHFNDMYIMKRLICNVSMRAKLCPKPLAFVNCTYLFTWSCLQFFSLYLSKITRINPIWLY